MRRPVVVVSRAELNRGDYVTVVPFTSSNLPVRRERPNCVAFRATDFGLSKDCVAQAEAVAQVHKSYLDFDAGVLGEISPDKMRDLVRALGYVIAAHCEPDDSA